MCESARRIRRALSKKLRWSRCKHRHKDLGLFIIDYYFEIDSSRTLLEQLITKIWGTCSKDEWVHTQTKWNKKTRTLNQQSGNIACIKPHGILLL